MKNDVKLSVNGRKDAIFNYFEVNDEGIKQKVEDLFKRIEEFAKDCKDSTDFEAKFATSELNQEYINIMTEVGTKCKSKVYTADPSDTKSDADIIKEDVEYEMKEAVDSMGRRVRRDANEKMLSEARSTPIIGDVLEAKQYMDLFGKFKKKGKDE